MKILILNSGSSSLKYQVIETSTGEVLAKGNYERIGEPMAFLTHKVHGEKHKFENPAKDHKEALEFVMTRLESPRTGIVKTLDEIGAVGHRIVHGGEKLRKPILVTEEVIKEIEIAAELAPLHNKAAILGIRACQLVLPGKPMVAVFDTGFHETIPEERYLYAIPYRFYEKYHVRKYGFHGTSHEYVANRVAEIMGKDIKDLKIINCHLGQGASVCAIQSGKSVETSMGLTPLGGIPMGTRSGDLDPSVVTFMMKKENLTADEVDNILNRESGVYGLSTLSVDFRDIEREALEGGKKSKRALDAYHYAVAAYVAKCAVAMGGIDVITFTAGVGEKSPYSRSEICQKLKIFGVEIDEQINANAKGEEVEISTPNSQVKVYVVPTNEELMIAKQTEKLVM